MGDYDLTGLSTRSFEQLVQRLALKAIGPGVSIFGDGRDGGREATFEGKVNYPSLTDPWDGYGVIQAKFKQRTGNADEDKKWALEQLANELNAYVDPESKRRKPQYYIFATNVVLSPVQESGGIDKAEEAIRAFAERGLPLKGFAVWHFDQICALLDVYEEVKRAHAAFITPGDVLSALLDKIAGSTPDFASIIHRFIQKQFQQDQVVRLEQAGHSADKPPALAKVFVDLPVSAHPSNEAPQEDPNQDSLPSGFVAELLSVSSLSFSIAAQEQGDVADALHEALFGQPLYTRGRCVLVGGPGQGKTTLAQFLSQLHRAALLLNRPSSSLSVETRTALADFNRQCEREGIPVAAARRFPIRIVLSHLAAELAKEEDDGPTSILAYITQQVAQRTDSQISTDNFRSWLGTYPWLLILDGLDEVPSSSNRDQVLQAVSDFWVDAAEANADILVIATTRPQGYNSEFAPENYTHLYLTPLSERRALHYGARLANARYGPSSERANKVIDRLARACGEEATLRLMQSPLQVTIMATLVDQVSQPPRERWRLFHEYYGVIYRREREKDLPTGEILRTQEATVAAIHYRAGLLLQATAETAGGTEALLTFNKFGSIIEEYLREEEFPEDELRTIKEQLLTACTERLVFLVSPQRDKVGFEIRSLQEFMAAGALMQASEDIVQERLQHIAHSSHWRNVFLFAAGHCFAGIPHLRDTIYRICASLNDLTCDRAAAVARAGSDLALDILEDGAANAHPRHCGLLASLALELLDHPAFRESVRLAEVYEPRLADLYQTELEKRFAAMSAPVHSGAWQLLAALADMGVDWALETANELWPILTNEEQAGVCRHFRCEKGNSWTFKLLVRSLPSLGPTRFCRALAYYALGRPVDVPEVDESLLDLGNKLSEHGDFARVPVRIGGNGRVATAPLVSVDETAHRRSIADMAASWQLDDGWLPAVAALPFLEDPSAVTLAAALDSCADEWHGALGSAVLQLVPWPVSACLSAADSAESLRRLAAKAQAGGLGTHDDWLAAEERWKREGLVEEDLEYLTDSSWPYDHQIARIGFPWSLPGLYLTGSDDTWFKLIVALLRDTNKSLEDKTARTHVADLFVHAVFGVKSLAAVPVLGDIGDLELITTTASSAGLAATWILRQLSKADAFSEGLNLLDFVGRTAYFGRHWYQSSLQEGDYQELCELFANNPNRHGLLRLMACVDASRYAEIVNPDLFRRGRSDDVCYEEAALSLSLAHREFNGLSPEELADWGLQVCSSKQEAMMAFMGGSGPRVASGEYEDFLLHVITKGEDELSPLTAYAVGLLGDEVSSRETGLRRESQAVSMSLPYLCL